MVGSLIVYEKNCLKRIRSLYHTIIRVYDKNCPAHHFDFNIDFEFTKKKKKKKQCEEKCEQTSPEIKVAATLKKKPRIKFIEPKELPRNWADHGMNDDDGVSIATQLIECLKNGRYPRRAPRAFRRLPAVFPLFL